MPNGEPMQPFFGGQQPGGDVRYSLPPTPLGSQAIPSGECRVSGVQFSRHWLSEVW